MTAATGPGIGLADHHVGDGAAVVEFVVSDRLVEPVPRVDRRRHRVDTHVACRGAVNVAGPTRTRTLSIAQQTGSGSSQGMRTTAILRMSLRR